jgi:hypothetical protein
MIDPPTKRPLFKIVDRPSLFLPSFFLLIDAIVEEMEAFFLIADLKPICILKVFNEVTMVFLP